MSILFNKNHNRRIWKKYRIKHRPKNVILWLDIQVRTRNRQVENGNNISISVLFLVLIWISSHKMTFFGLCFIFYMYNKVSRTLRREAWKGRAHGNFYNEDENENRNHRFTQIRNWSLNRENIMSLSKEKLRSCAPKLTGSSTRYGNSTLKQWLFQSEYIKKNQFIHLKLF